MNAEARRSRGKSGLALVEEAVHLMRRTPAGTLACYYLGSLPFVLGALFFWADMSRSPYAADHLAEAALGLALLFVWMKCWQTVFACRLRAAVATIQVPRWTWRQCGRLFLQQAVLQPSGLLMIPLTSMILVPLGWVFAFYQNVTVLGDGESPEIMALLKRAGKQSGFWPRQNHSMLIVLGGLALCVFINLVTVCLSLPFLAKTLLGIDSIYAHSAMSMLNSTFFAAVLALTYLCVDPVVKAVYVLRCFYGDAITTGEDLKAELKHSGALAGALAAIVVVLLAIAPASNSAGAAEATAVKTPDVGQQAAPSPGVAAPELDRAINEVLHQPKYTWRMPRTRLERDSEKEGIMARFWDRVGGLIKKWINAIGDWLDRLIDRWFHGSSHSPGGNASMNWADAVRGLIIVVLIVLVGILVVLLVRSWQRSKRNTAAVASVPLMVVPDLADESVTAEHLPEDGWLKLGRELLERGELRLALRAFYFASLTQLASRNLIFIAKFKSNLDYENELNRRAHSLPEVRGRFGDNVEVFDRTWYGLHDVNAELVRRFLENVERIRTAAS